MMPNMLNKAAADWGQLILHAGLQAALAAGLVFVVLLLTRRRASSQLRYAILLVVLVKFATPPFLNMTTGVFSQSRAVRTQVVSVTLPASIESAQFITGETLPAADTVGDISSPNSVKPDDPTPESVSNAPAVIESPRATTGFPWLALLMFAHLSGTALFIALLIRRYRSVRQVVLAGEIQQDGFLCSELARISTQLAIKRLPELRLSDEADAPFAFGALRPVIVMPRLIADQLHADQLAIVIAHELVHVRRRDLLVGWIETLVSIVWWFHPAMWWLKNSLRQTREDCCDDVLLANQLAEPARYCETLIDAASRQTTTLAEPLALGFTDRQHPAARRIRRLMDSSLFRADRLRWSAIGVIVLVALVLLPGMRPDRQAVTEVNTDGRLGRWLNPPLQISESEAVALQQCRKIAQSYWHYISGGRKEFHQIETREKLKAILANHSDLFYAQHLLGTWHQLNGDLEKAKQLLKTAIDNAPVVLTQRYVYGDGSPATGLDISQIGFDFKRVYDPSRDPTENPLRSPILNLKFIWLMTDANGEIHLPVYDTAYRTNGVVYNSGKGFPYHYGHETKHLGWFKSHSRNGVLPDITIWKSWSRPRYFTRTASDSWYLNDATGGDKTEVESGSNTYQLGSAARGQADGTFVIENGKGTNQSPPTIPLPIINNGNFVDHAVIDLAGPAPSRFEIRQVEILDSQTKIRLQEFQDGAGFKRAGKQRFHLFSWWNTLPDSVDLVLYVGNYDANYFRHTLPAKLNASVQHNGNTFTITHLIAGQHVGGSFGRNDYSFHGEPEDVSTKSEMLLEIKAINTQWYSLWVVRKDGRRLAANKSLFLSQGNHIEFVRIPAALDDVDYFELLPHTEPAKIYFENIQLPARNDSLKQLPMIEFPVGGVAKKFTSDLLNPMKLQFEIQHGHAYSGTSSDEHGMVLVESTKENRSPEIKTTFVWANDLGVDFDHTLEVVDPETRVGGGSHFSGGSLGSIFIGSWREPLETIQKVRLKILPKQVAP